ncbi:MAG TPA: flagellar basal body rod protein FlgC [Candidatus Sulfotelmatobacter sp.]|jgi:flagellar basal-body rod protein FlgC|nr:flagellar basal body rod protein FlgC [Candidatus Sulfotelmatobacter sp.]
MNLFGMLEVSGSAMAAERWRAEVVSANMANAETTRTPQGGAYRRQLVVFRGRPTPHFPLMLARLHSEQEEGVRVDRVVTDSSPLPRRYQPGHPDADASGYVTYPNVNPVMEMTDLLGAVRAYQLNASAVQAAKNMLQQSLQILS